MKVYNQNKTQILDTYDLSKGYLKEDVITIVNKAIPEVKEIGHYQVINEYPNGGKDLMWVVDRPGQSYQPASIEKETIQVYIPYTNEELQKIENKKQINNYKKYLKDTDYIANKLAEANAKYIVSGNMNEIKELLVKYDTILNTRKSYREQISILELSL